MKVELSLRHEDVFVVSTGYSEELEAAWGCPLGITGEEMPLFPVGVFREISSVISTGVRIFFRLSSREGNAIGLATHFESLVTLLVCFCAVEMRDAALFDRLERDAEKGAPF